MSTLATAELSDSDPEDVDFRPPSPKRRRTSRTKRSASASSSLGPSSGEASDDDEDADTASLKAEQAAAVEEERKRKAAEAFKAMRDEVSSKPNRTEGASEEGVRMVEVKRARRFAGETIYETVSLPATDPEAVAYLAAQERSAASVPEQNALALGHGAAMTDAPPSSTASTSTIPAPSSSAQPSSSLAPRPPSLPHSSSAPAAPPLPSQQQPPAKRPPPKRKPRQSLESLAASLTGKKMTTLEKSQLDWKAHTAADAQVQDELESHRRGGGYLERKDFLERVGERRAGQREDEGAGRRGR